MSIVVDTDVVSYLFRGSPLGENYIPILENRQAVISFMTLAELLLWPLRSQWGEARERRLRNFLDERFEVCFPDGELCALWAEIRHRGYAKGHPVEPSDAWIAATALYFHAPLVTHNERQYRDIDRLEIITTGGMS